MDRSEDTTVVDDTYLEEQKEDMVSAYRTLFAENDKMVNRAVN